MGRAPRDDLGGRLGVAVPAQPLTVPPGPRQRHVFGKPLRWSRGWAIVLVVWLLAGGVLSCVRIAMGHMDPWSAHEAAAVAKVRAYTPDGSHTTSELLAALSRELVLRGRDGGPPRWYAFERSWEGRVYVVWEWSPDAALSFTVHGAAVHPDDESRLVLRAVAKSLPAR